MVSNWAALGLTALYLAFAAVDIFTFLDPQCGAGTTASADEEAAQLLDSVAEVLPPLVAVVLVFGAVVLTNRHLILMGRRVGAVPVAAGAGNNRRRSTSGLVMFVLCVSAGTLEFFVFGGQAAAAGGGGGGADHGARARALGLAALRALPGAATATFFLGMMLIFVAHVRAGGEGGGGAVAGAGAGGGPHQGLLRLLTKVAAGMAAALVGLMLMALTLHGSNCRS